MKKIADLISTNKKQKMIALSVILAVTVTLIATTSLTKETQKEPLGNNNGSTIDSNRKEATWEEQVGKSYANFTDEEVDESEKALEAAKEYYLDEYGEIRETSVFFAETLKNGNYIVSGIDTMDDRDSRFILLKVNVKEKTVTPVDKLTQD